MVMGVPLVALPAAALAGIRTQTFSSFSLAAHGTGSVAEASALIAAGEGARLLGPRQISPDRMATCALAQGFFDMTGFIFIGAGPRRTRPADPAGDAT